jgi:hypothetical protein
VDPTHGDGRRRPLRADSSPGSGSLGGTVVARLIGLSPLRSFLACATAGIAVAILYASMGEPLRRWLDRREIGTDLRIAGAVVTLVVVLVLVKVVRRFARRAPPAGPEMTPK